MTALEIVSTPRVTVNSIGSTSGGFVVSTLASNGPKVQMRAGEQFDAWLLQRRYDDFAKWQDANEPNLDNELFDLAIEAWEDID